MRKLDYELQVPQDDMSAIFRIGIAKCGDNTPEKREVHDILVEPRPYLKAKIKRYAREDGVGKIESDTETVAHGLRNLGAISVQSRGPNTDGVYEKVLEMVAKSSEDLYYGFGIPLFGEWRHSREACRRRA